VSLSKWKTLMVNRVFLLLSIIFFIFLNFSQTIYRWVTQVNKLIDEIKMSVGNLYDVALIFFLVDDRIFLSLHAFHRIIYSLLSLFRLKEETHTTRHLLPYTNVSIQTHTHTHRYTHIDAKSLFHTLLPRQGTSQARPSDGHLAPGSASAVRKHTHTLQIPHTYSNSPPPIHTCKTVYALLAPHTVQKPSVHSRS